MQKFKTLLTVCLCAVTMTFSMGCNSNSKDVYINGNPALKNPPAEEETYKNFFEDDRIAGQWQEYGIGDPFIYRFDGTYYLICSTKAQRQGVKGWKSKDLINWEQVDNGVCTKGFIVSETVTESFDAWASEVYYLDGTFYLVESRNGKGHYVMASSSPEGPFEPITEGTIDSAIDGSLYMDINGRMVLFTANSSVTAAYMADDMKSAEEKTLLKNATMTGWTEGPEVFTRDGIRYYFYTGNGVTQRAYRINYSYGSADKSVFDDELTQGPNVLLNTDDDWYGLGHGCVISGPDLDSYYLGFHNSYAEGNSGGRRFNIGRLLFNGSDVVMQHTGLYENVMPNLPDYAEYDSANLAQEDGYLLSGSEHKDSFTVEFNFTGTGKAVFSYKNPSDYGYLTFDGSKIDIHRVQSGKDTLVKSCKTFRTYKTDVFHAIKIGYKNGLMDVTFDYQEIANDLQVGAFKSGKAGYYGDFSYIGSLIFNNTAQGDSDKEAVKQENIPSVTYTEQLSKLGKNSGIQAARKTLANDITESTYEMKLANAGDYATYLEYVSEDGSYGLDMTVYSRYGGKTIGVQVDGGTIYKWTIPDYGKYAYDGYMKVKVADLNLKKGNHYITIWNMQDEFAFQSMYIERNYNVKGTVYQHDLKTYPEYGIWYPTFLDSTDDGLATTSSARYLCTFGDGTLEDLEISCDVKLTGDNGTGIIGLVIAADKWAFNNTDLDNYKSLQGDYFAFNNTKVTIIRSNYQYSDESCRDIFIFDTNRVYNIKAVKQGKVLTMYVDGKKVLETFDPMGKNRGYCGLYANYIEGVFSNLKITTL